MSNAVEYVERVGLIDRAAFALRNRANTEGLSKTDVINRALQLYDFIRTEMEKGHEVRLFDPETNRYAAVRLLD